MTTIFVEMLKPFLTLSKFFGLIHVCCMMENGKLRRDTSLTYYLFLEVVRTFVLLIFSYRAIYIERTFIITYLNVIKYWIIFVTARISEKWIIKFINSIIEFDRKMRLFSNSSLLQYAAVQLKSLGNRFWNTTFVVFFIYFTGMRIYTTPASLVSNLDFMFMMNIFFRTPEVVLFTVMITSFFYIYNLGTRFHTLNSMWKSLPCGLRALPTSEWTNSEITMSMESIRLWHAELSELLSLFSLAYGPILLEYFAFCFLYDVFAMFLIIVYRSYRIELGAVPYIFSLQYTIFALLILGVTSWVIEEKKRIIPLLRLLRISDMPIENKLQVKLFMDQISMYESNELSAFGFFKFNLKLVMSILVLLVTVMTTLIQMKDHPIMMYLRHTIEPQFYN